MATKEIFPKTQICSGLMSQSCRSIFSTTRKVECGNNVMRLLVVPVTFCRTFRNLLYHNNVHTESRIKEKLNFSFLETPLYPE